MRANRHNVVLKSPKPWLVAMTKECAFSVLKKSKQYAKAVSYTAAAYCLLQIQVNVSHTYDTVETQYYIEN